jgi:molybdopterin-containing oxidoreductase family molybdopterin binding subunit
MGKTALRTPRDEWIPTVCNMCFNNCAVKVHVVDGVVVKIEGNPDHPSNLGHCCGKGNAGIMQLYDPARITKPLRRTNPQKSIDSDPGWEEMSWDEAYTEVAHILNDALSREGGGKNIISYGIVSSMVGSIWTGFFMGSLGGMVVMPDICGVGVHGVLFLETSCGLSTPDYDYCKYVLQFGSQKGSSTCHGGNMTTWRQADARTDRAMKLVVVDPHMSTGAEKADIWLPIRPGTDTFLAMAIAHVIVHELDHFDREYMIKKTNACNLVDVETGRVLKDEETTKALVWDEADGSIKRFDSPDVKQPTLFGTYRYGDRTVKPAFQVYKEHLGAFTPEKAEAITTIPAAKIRQVATEFVEAACIGQTITIEGKEYPLRPACTDSFSGVSRHKNSLHAHQAIHQLNLLVGSANNPGGIIGYGPVCKGFTDEYKVPAWQPNIWPEEGLIEHTTVCIGITPTSMFDKEVVPPTTTAYFEITPFNEPDPHWAYVNQLNPDKCYVKPPQVLWVQGGNPAKNWGNFDEMADFMRTFEKVIGVDIYLNDSSYFYDIVLPEASFLERYDMMPNLWFNHHTAGYLDVPWSLSLRQPVVPARDDAPDVITIYNNIADKMGITEKWNGFMNEFFSFGGKGGVGYDANLPLDRKASVEEVLDLVYKSICGPDKGLEWFKKNGVYSYPRKPEEVYYLNESEGRVVFYWDFMLRYKDDVERVTKECGIDWDVSYYSALPEWHPCHDLEIHNPGYDLYPIYNTTPINVDSWSMQNPWINEATENDPYGYTIEINSATAKEKGFKSGDDVYLRAANGYEIKGRLVLVEGIHPECLSVGGGCWGSQSDYLPNSKDKGAPVVNLLTVNDPSRYDNVSAAYDQCVRVKLVKA